MREPVAMEGPAAASGGWRGRPSPWDEIDYSVPLPEGFVMPEHHWPALAEATFLTPPQRIRANRAALSFSCEMFIQCETYVITYLEERRRRIGGLVPDTALDRFVAEEREHIEAFYRLLDTLNGGRYGDRKLKLMRWTFWDRLMLWLAPPVSLFTIAALFEEMSLPVPAVMDERPDQSYAPVRAVMDLHAKEEKFHIHLDDRALERSQGRLPRWLYALQLWLALPLMAYVDGVLARAWRRAMKDFAAAERLPAGEARRLLRRRPSRSDVLGIESFIAKMGSRPLPGSRLFAAVLATAIR
ncbi:MAG TPA: hypothetical protein VFB81_04225 [Myxococcales bacterium]|nr:hypothetical protein [Myxococcales bacterium]